MKRTLLTTPPNKIITLKGHRQIKMCGPPTEIMFQHKSRTVQAERNFKVKSAHFWDLPKSYNMITKQGVRTKFFSFPDQRSPCSWVQGLTGGREKKWMGRGGLQSCSTLGQGD